MIIKAQLEERLNIRNKRRSAIVIMINNKEDVSKLCAKELRFGGALKVVEKYWKAELSLVYMTCSRIDHDQLRRCNQRPE